MGRHLTGGAAVRDCPDQLLAQTLLQLSEQSAVLGNSFQTSHAHRSVSETMFAPFALDAYEAVSAFASEGVVVQSVRATI